MAQAVNMHAAQRALEEIQRKGYSGFGLALVVSTAEEYLRHGEVATISLKQEILTEYLEQAGLIPQTWRRRLIILATDLGVSSSQAAFEEGELPGHSYLGVTMPSGTRLVVTTNEGSFRIDRSGCNTWVGESVDEAAAKLLEIYQLDPKTIV